jgi:RNA polymerase sigma-70 factor (ECF subfamily)
MNDTGEAPLDVQFEQQRERLLHLAYRMVGSLTEAEDLVQDTWLRWHGADQASIREPAAWLTTTITRLALDHLKSARHQRETYVGPWLPEPIITSEGGPLRDHGELAGYLSSALLMVLERLAPTERAAFLLREVFDYDYKDIAAILDLGETNCRQIVSRARKRVRGERPRFEVPKEQQTSMIQSFAQACMEGDMDGLLALFEEDITLYSDGGGKVVAALRPVYTADRVARFFVGLSRKRPADLRIDFGEVNGEPGLLLFEGTNLVSVFSFDYGPNGMREIYVVRNPEKLVKGRIGGPAGAS